MGQGAEVEGEGLLIGLPTAEGASVEVEQQHGELGIETFEGDAVGGGIGEGLECGTLVQRLDLVGLDEGELNVYVGLDAMGILVVANQVGLDLPIDIHVGELVAGFALNLEVDGVVGLVHFVAEVGYGALRCRRC